ncbi:PEPxxWA-CTERM sorting domain-containing protein [Sandarakinorhabdus sp. AAP62]|uniref:PEPxxWA-CTERM sorting domain-containing protein n=1 Tax=Sandarakinorhabdus sp. AAP62 TaxID=1248916 RepID=UPI001FB0ADA5|nr:PEPxxWA-CTERM sorting domain-containing protein [Sandarakinorhabdus sp. AAP62]
MTRFAKLVVIMFGGASMVGSVQAATPISVTQSTTAAQFTTTQVQSANGGGTFNFPGTVSTTGPTLVPISRFDTSTGILVGARMSVNIPYSMSVSATGLIPASGSGRTVDVTSGIAGTVTIAGTNISTTSFAASPKCNSGDCLNQSNNNTATTTGTLTGNATVATANLASLTGTSPGSVNFSTSVNNTNTQIINGSAVTTGFATSNFVIGSTTQASNQYSVTYDYLNFANPSFNTGSVVTTSTLDFGTLALNSGLATLNFNITNIGNINSAGLELFQINGPGNAQFSSNISPFLDLAGGNTSAFTASFNPLNVGLFSGAYTFLFRDHAPGGVGIRNYSLTLNVIGNVFDPVPEPASWMTMLLGFGLVGSIARRRALGQPG